MSRFFFFLFVIINMTFVNGQYEGIVSNDVNKLKFYYYPSLTEKIELNFWNLFTSRLIPGAPTTIIIDGLLSNSTSPMSLSTMESLVSLGKRQNVIVVDWGALSGGNFYEYGLTATEALEVLYPYAVPNVVPVGNRVAEFISLVRIIKQIHSRNIHVIGHSLGSHVSGQAATFSKTKLFSKFGRVSGLDPARGPLISQSLIFSGQADFVDLYHTNRGGFGDNETNLGDIDVFINGGTFQPPCLDIPVELLAAYCSHSYSWEFYSSSIFNSAIASCPCTIPYCFCTPVLGEDCELLEICPVKTIVGYYASSRSRGDLYLATTS